MLTEQQVNERIAEETELEAKEDATIRRKRQFQPNEARLWQRDLDYYVDPSLSAQIADWVREGMRWINANTCLTVREARDKSRARKPYVSFVDGSWCLSFVGMVRKGEQIIQMSPRCADVGTVIHEFSHALGFYHEQSRDDRDKYVNIDYNNIQPSLKYAFNTHNTDNYHWPYIYGSVMAYSGTAFSTGGGKLTIVTEDERNQRELGWRMGAFADMRRINTAYKCIDDCRSGPACKNGGFRHPKQCNVCKCPEAFDGHDCGRLRKAVDPSGSNRGCGGVIQLKNNERDKKIELKIKSNGQKKYHYCFYEIKAPGNQVVKLRWANEQGDYMPCGGGCNFGFVEMNPGVKMIDGTMDYGLPGFRDCCHKQLDSTPVVSETNSIIVTTMARSSNVQIHIYASAVRGGGGGNPPPPTATTQRPTRRTTQRVTPTTAKKATYQDYLKCYKGCTKQYSAGGRSYSWVTTCIKNCERIRY